MVQYCRKCGHELEDDAEFCDKCGFELNSKLVKDEKTDEKSLKNESIENTDENKPTENKYNEDISNKNKSTGNKSEFLTKLPLILAIIAIIAGVGESLGTPMLMGWDSILMAMGLSIVGGLLGIFFLEKMDEPVIAAAEFIVTGVLIFMFIGRFGEISAIIFIISAILTLYIKGMRFSNKKLFAIPILTFILVFILLIAGGAVYQFNAENSVTVGNITQNITDGGYGYYSGDVSGDIRVDSNFDYLEVKVNYYDNEGKVIDSVIGWNELNVNGGKTYKFEGNYFNEKQPAKAEIIVIDSAKSTTPLYTENLTILTSSGV